MPTIRVDNEVMQELQQRAYREGLVFGSPNQVLRLVLELDSRNGVSGRVAQLSEGGSVSARETPSAGERRRRVTGRSLLRSHVKLPQNLRAYSDREGCFYEWPRSFPAILFDRTGYRILETEEDMRKQSQFLYLYPETLKINAQAQGGISSIPGYVQCCNSHY